MNPSTSRLATFLVLLVAASLPLAAEDSGVVAITDNTLRLAEGVTAPPASLDSLAWMAGLWAGEGLGGKVEESWTPPSAGSMIGTFKLIDVKDGSETPNFYEFMTIFETEGSLDLRLKHFHPDVTGWEEKDDFVSFPFVKAEGNRVYFRGLTYEKRSEDELKIYLAMRTRDGTREVTFEFERVK